MEQGHCLTTQYYIPNNSYRRKSEHLFLCKCRAAGCDRQCLYSDKHTLLPNSGGKGVGGGGRGGSRGLLQLEDSKKLCRVQVARRRNPQLLFILLELNSTNKLGCPLNTSRGSSRLPVSWHTRSDPHIVHTLPARGDTDKSSGKTVCYVISTVVHTSGVL